MPAQAAKLLGGNGENRLHLMKVTSAVGHRYLFRASLH